MPGSCTSPSALVQRTEPAGPSASGARGAAGQDGHSDSTRASDAVAWSLLKLLAELPHGHPERAGVRDQLVEMYLPLARYCARRFRNRGEPFDDLVQVANLALLKSVDGFDSGRGVAFPSYAVPMIVGELKRHFRDLCWGMRVPRRVQETRLRIREVFEDLTHELRRSPTVADLAGRLGLAEDAIIEGLEAARVYRLLSLHAPINGGDGTGELGELIGGPDLNLERAEERHAVRALLSRLPARQQRIVALRYFGNLTQAQIAVEVGLSQMHVSRLLAQSLRSLYRGLVND
ncbi:SigB/SigF/SigG family RNA polymerase sigma factor [Dactylosporangium sp. NPDC049525]|uniref:SigB/SigF/SigG family RNA polymerase sigma factor n=1 Tax=Dactylosporangium sp. NPDC049525 TaxID=3154730 RepID=UPI00342E0564